jgi:hypothetical protein
MSQSPPAAPAPATAATAAPAALEIMRQEHRIVAAPMTPDDQHRVLDLITATNMISMQADRKVQDALRQIDELRSTLEDLKSRQSLNEATASVLAASHPAPAAQATPQPVNAVSAPVQPKTNCTGRPQYVIASVSPRYVTLRSGREPALIDQTVGSVVPCYGTIREIKQDGARWLVKTDHDVIGGG